MTEAIELPKSGSKPADNFARTLVNEGLVFALYGTKFRVALRPTQLTVERTDEGARWSGTFELSGTFSGSFSAILQVDDDGDWAFGFETPFDIPGFLDGSVKPLVDDTAWSIIKANLSPLAALFERPMIVIAGQSGTISSPESGTSYWYQPGINFFAPFDLAEIEPFCSMLAMLPPTGPCPVILRITWLWNGPTFGWIVDGLAPSNQTIIPGVMRWGGIEGYVGGAGSDHSFGVVTYFNVDAGGTPLALQGGAELAVGEENTKLALWAALDAANGAWKHPFGIPGITITQFGVQLNLPWTTWITALAFRGGFVIGSDALDAEFAWLFDDKSPENSVISVHSESGLAFDRLARALLPKSCLVADLLGASLRDVDFYLSPKGGWVAGKYYDPGFALSGALDLWGYRASLAGRVDYTSGGMLRGELERIDIRAADVHLFSLTGFEGEGSPSVDIELTPAKQRMQVSGEVSLFGGSKKSSLLATISSRGFRFVLDDQPALGMYGKVAISYETGSFRLQPKCGFGVHVKLAGLDIDVGVGCAIDIRCDDRAFEQGLTFTAELAARQQFRLKHAIPLEDVSAVRELFEQELYDDLKRMLEAQLKSASTVVFQWVEDNVTRVASEAARLFESVGADEGAIAKQLTKVYNLDVDDAVKLVADSGEEAAKIMKDTFDMSAKQVSKALDKTWKMGKKDIEKAMKKAGFSSKSIENAFKSVWNSIF